MVMRALPTTMRVLADAMTISSISIREAGLA
jgi:hypothetical protein